MVLEWASIHRQELLADWAFADDVAKTNLTAIFQQGGLENVRSL